MTRSVPALVLALLLAACGSSPPTHFFTLTAVPAKRAAHADRLQGPPLQVRDIQLPATLDRTEMVLRGPGPQVQVMGEDRWAAPLVGMIRETLTKDLRDRLGENAVLSPGAPEPPGGVQVLILNVQQFAADATGEVTLDADWSLGRGNPPKAAVSRHASIRTAAGSSQPAAVAEGMSRALGELADRIAAQL